MTVRTKIEGSEGEIFLIPAKAFDLIGNLPDGEVEISPGKKNTIMIKAEKIKNKYQTLEPETFPASGMLGDDDKETTIDSNLLLASMKRVSYAIPAVQSHDVCPVPEGSRRNVELCGTGRPCSGMGQGGL